MDETCVLCSKCFESSDHEDHTVYVSVSPGNSGCCDCGDAEAWRKPVKCAIHTPSGDSTTPMDTDSVPPQLPSDLVNSIRATIARALDYICDVISCSPEQLRLEKSVEAIRKDEEQSRLTSRYGEIEPETDMEYALILWNDEKHTASEVQKQVTRACRESTAFGKERARETDDVGRSIVCYSRDIPQLLETSRIIEQIRVTVTIRSARDTFREQMCGTIIEWLQDITGCNVGDDNAILRRTVCEELLGVWRVGSKASNTEIGKDGIDDHSFQEEREHVAYNMRFLAPIELAGLIGAGDQVDQDEMEEMEVDFGDGQMDREFDGDYYGDGVEAGGMDEDDTDMVGRGAGTTEYSDGDLLFRVAGIGVPRPPTFDGAHDRRLDHLHPSDDPNSGAPQIPHTPNLPPGSRPKKPAPSHWAEKPFLNQRVQLPPHEDLRQRVRLDWLIMFDLRLWKRARVDLRDLYITSVVVIPQFKRILGLRFAGLYPALAELYLVADREPDHSIINMSLQMLTTPSITAEVVRRGNFLSTLMAIIYTFLTTRQVGHPHQVNPTAILAFDGGLTNPLTNRRMYHFFHDMRYLLGSDYVKERLRMEPRYNSQFLDLARLHQGICPNVRAVSEHVEYEAEAWISASLVTREMNKLARQFSEAFRGDGITIQDGLRRVIPMAAKYTTVSSMGWDRARFRQSETKSETEFKEIGGFQFDTDRWGKPNHYRVVRFCVDKQAISFHHALHYTLSWLIEAGNSMPNKELRNLLLLSWNQVKDQVSFSVAEFDPEDMAVAIFDFPLRVCVWLAQMKTGMWVRNGFSLKHQMQTYRSVSQRDLTHHRDIFLLQTSLVTVRPSRMLVSMIDRFNLNQWMEGNYAPPTGYDEAQVLDLAEDFLHLLIVILSDRLPLTPLQDEPDLHAQKIRRELVHILCFKPMTYSDLARHVPERLSETDEFQGILEDIANYRAPDGLADSGTFELKEKHLDEVDPYIIQFTKNQREEIEANYRARIAKKTGKPEADIVFEPHLRPIKNGVFKDLAAFTRTPIFAQIIYCSLAYALQFKTFTPSIPETRVETFLLLVLYLCQLAVLEDNSLEHEFGDSFVLHALEKKANASPTPIGMEGGDNGHRTIATALYRLANVEGFKACWAKINHVLRSFKQKRPGVFATVATWAAGMGEKFEMEEDDSKETEAQKKKQLAKERQAKIMAQFKQQQQTFMDVTGLNYEDDDYSDSDSENTAPHEEMKRLWKYPAGTCILCQEDMNESRLYGSLTFVTESNILRQTDPTDADYVYEVAKTPGSLDRSADDIRPFGVAKMNRRIQKKLASDGSEVVVERQGLGRGFPAGKTKPGPVVTGCSHLMHFHCFDHYYDSVRRRQPLQIARNHPENLERREFVCPLCKALGNAFLPIIWKSKEETLTGGALQPDKGFFEWLAGPGSAIGRLGKAVTGEDRGASKIRDMFYEYGRTDVVAPIASKLQPQQSPSIEPEVHPEVRARTDSPLIAPHPSAPQVPSQLDELERAYIRLRNTFKDNGIPSGFTNLNPPRTQGSYFELAFCDSLVRSLGFSISTLEIAQRGTESELGRTLLDRIPPQMLSQLRILSDTVSSYFAIGVLRSRGGGGAALHQFREMEKEQLQRLFIGHQQIFDSRWEREADVMNLEPLLASDAFLFLSECSCCAVPGFSWDILHVVRLCFIAELVRAIITFGRGCGLADILHGWERSESLSDIEGHIGYTELQLDSLKRFASFIEQAIGVDEAGAGGIGSHSGFALAVFRHLVGAYATPFLRKSVILLHTRFGVLFPPSGFAEADEPEAVRLCKILGVPTVDELFATCMGDDEEGQCLRAVIAGWCKHLTLKHGQVSMSHPAIFELVGLPKNYDVLVEEAMKRKCPTSGGEITDPTLCLFCGEIFCSQALCCLKESEEEEQKTLGGCNRHMPRRVSLAFPPQTNIVMLIGKMLQVWRKHRRFHKYP